MNKITREEAIKWLENLKNDIGKMQFRALWDYAQAIDEIIKLLQAETKWIPVSEGLPKEDAKYLVQMSYGIMRVLNWANILEKVDDFDFHNKKYGGWYEYDDEWGYCERHEVVAWMPLPIPYKGEVK